MKVYNWRQVLQEKQEEIVKLDNWPDTKIVMGINELVKILDEYETILNEAEAINYWDQVWDKVFSELGIEEDKNWP